MSIKVATPEQMREIRSSSSRAAMKMSKEEVRQQMINNGAMPQSFSETEMIQLFDNVWVNPKYVEMVYSTMERNRLVTKVCMLGGKIWDCDGDRVNYVLGLIKIS